MSASLFCSMASRVEPSGTLFMTQVLIAGTRRQ